MRILCLLEGGPSYEIEAGGRRFFFEMNWYAGPTVLNRNTHDPIVAQPGERSLFWDAVACWEKQGKRVKDGVCVWNQEHGAEFKDTHGSY